MYFYLKLKNRFCSRVDLLHSSRILCLYIYIYALYIINIIIYAYSILFLRFILLANNSQITLNWLNRVASYQFGSQMSRRIRKKSTADTLKSITIDFAESIDTLGNVALIDSHNRHVNCNLRLKAIFSFAIFLIFFLSTLLRIPDPFEDLRSRPDFARDDRRRRERMMSHTNSRAPSTEYLSISIRSFSINIVDGLYLWMN